MTGIKRGEQQAAGLQQSDGRFQRGNAGVGMGGELFVAAGQVAEIEHGGSQWGVDIIRQPFVAGVNQRNLLCATGSLQALGGVI